MNTTLHNIIKKADVKSDMLDINSILKINGFNGDYSKGQLRKSGATILKDKLCNIMNISIISDDNIYLGGIMIIIRNKSKHSCLNLNDYIIEKHDKGFTKHLVYNGTKYGKLKHILEAIETEIITEAVEKTDNKSAAIQLLGLSRRTFYHKIKKIRS